MVTCLLDVYLTNYYPTRALQPWIYHLICNKHQIQICLPSTKRHFENWKSLCLSFSWYYQQKSLLIGYTSPILNQWVVSFKSSTLPFLNAKIKRSIYVFLEKSPIIKVLKEVYHFIHDNIKSSSLGVGALSPLNLFKPKNASFVVKCSYTLVLCHKAKVKSSSLKLLSPLNLFKPKNTSSIVKWSYTIVSWRQIKSTFCNLIKHLITSHFSLSLAPQNISWKKIINFNDQLKLIPIQPSHSSLSTLIKSCRSLSSQISKLSPFLITI